MIEKAVGTTFGAPSENTLLTNPSSLEIIPLGGSRCLSPTFARNAT